MLLETVPNLSEGRDAARMGRLAALMEPALLDVHSDPDHHRTVLTAVGSGPDLEEALSLLAQGCIDEIDIRQHDGAHPRLGALDVVPIVPLRKEDGDAAMELAARVTRRFAAMRLGVYRYGDGSRSLPEVRRAAMAGAPPDVGAFHPSAGAVCVGVRPLLAAFNLDLDLSVGLAAARTVAADVRGPDVRALAFSLPRQARMQVSTNLVRPDRVGLEQAWRLVRAALAERGLPAPVGAELVGLVPKTALAGISDELAELTGARERVLEERCREL